jgi:perosamine synthetase
VTRSFRGTPADPERLHRFRRQPSAPLLAVLLRRLRTFDGARLARRGALGEQMSAELPSEVFHPGGALVGRTHWLYPVVVADPDALVAQLQGVGVDASRGTSNLEVVATTTHPAPRCAAGTMAGIVYLPIYPDLPEEVRRRILTVLSGPGSPHP